MDERDAPLDEGLPDDLEPLPEDAEVPTMEPVLVPDDFEPDEPLEPAEP